MTIDKNRLKALAEAARDYSGDEVSVHEGHLDALAYAADPATILALLGDIERLERIHARYSDSACRLGELLNVPEDDQCMPEVESAAVALVGEIDQLKAENEALRERYEILMEAASNMLHFSDPTCMNDEKWRDRVEAMAKEHSRDH